MISRKHCTERCLKRADVGITRKYTCRLRRAGSVKTGSKWRRCCNLLCCHKNYWKENKIYVKYTQVLYNSVLLLFLKLLFFFFRNMFCQERLYFVILLLCSVLVLSNETTHTHGVRCSLRCAKPKLRQGEIYSKCHLSYPLKLNCSAEEISLQLQNVSFL